MSEADQVSEGEIEAIAPPRIDKAVVIWISVLLAMTFVMVFLGGLTRLTQSGLSMVEWQPLTGWLPPQTDAAWQDVFSKYRQFPEYQHINVGMTLEEFKEIYLMEYAHRLWGRMIGVVFILPFVLFAWRRRIGAATIRMMSLIFVLGMIQAGMGWYMVMSGLAQDPDVSAYRLTAHLGLGTLILGTMLWTLLRAAKPAPADHGNGGRIMVRAGSIFVCLLIFKTILAGGFVAGLDAGFTYNTFPLMDGQLVPEGLGDLSPAYLNLFENITTVQFNHRLLAMVTAIAVLMLWLSIGGRRLAPLARRAAGWLLAATLVQVSLGIATLLLVVPIPLAVAHQSCAMLVFACALWTVYELRPGDTAEAVIDAKPADEQEPLQSEAQGPTATV